MPDDGCVFCDILEDREEADRLHEDDRVVAFRDINPQAPVHFLVIPRDHIPTVNDLVPEDADLVGHMVTVAQNLAAEQGVADDGYRLVVNCGKDSGQEVFHLHLHCLAGRPLDWPPG